MLSLNSLRYSRSMPKAKKAGGREILKAVYDRKRARYSSGQACFTVMLRFLFYRSGAIKTKPKTKESTRRQLYLIWRIE